MFVQRQRGVDTTPTAGTHQRLQPKEEKHKKDGDIEKYARGDAGGGGHEVVEVLALVAQRLCVLIVVGK